MSAWLALRDEPRRERGRRDAVELDRAAAREQQQDVAVGRCPGREGLALQVEAVAFGGAEAVDLVAAGAGGEHVAVRPAAAGHGVVALVAPDRVVAGAGD